MLPGPGRRTEWDVIGNGHLRALHAELTALGWSLYGVTAGELLSPGDAAPAACVTHIHWTESLTLAAPQPLWVKLLTRFQTTAGRTRPHLLLERFARRLIRRIAARRPLIYQVHDLDSNWLEPARAHLLDRAFKLACLKEAHAWVIHEHSCLPLINRLAPPPPHVAVCPLGDYARFHGASIPRAAARQRFGWPERDLVFLYAGYSGARRNPAATLTAFLRLGDARARLIIASRNSRHYLPDSPPRVHVHDALLDNTTFRDLYCAADWIVMPGRDYLNSAVVRTALSYGRPVICIDFGAQSEMARGAALWLRDDSAEAIHEQLAHACAMPPPAYEAFARAALERNAERTWEQTARNHTALVEQLLSSSPDAASTSLAR